MSVNELAVADDARAQTRTEGDDDEVLHSLCVAEYHLADGGGVGVVCDGDVDTRERSLDVVHEVEHAARLVGIGLVVAELPEVGRGLDHTGVIVGIGGADAYTDELEIERYAADQGVHRLAQSLDVCLIVIELLVLFGRDGRFAEDCTVLVDETERSIGSADIDTHCKFFHDDCGSLWFIKKRNFAYGLQVKVNIKLFFIQTFS